MRKTRGCFHTYMQADAPASPPPLLWDFHIEKQDPHRPEEWWATSHILWGETALSQHPVCTEMSQNVLRSSVLDCIREPVTRQYDLVFQSLSYSLHHHGRNANITNFPKAGGVLCLRVLISTPQHRLLHVFLQWISESVREKRPPLENLIWWILTKRHDRPLTECEDRVSVILIINQRL